MIGEDVLEAALAREAAAYDVPADGPARILAAVDAGAAGPGRRARWPLAVVAAVGIVAVGAVALARLGGGDHVADRQATGQARPAAPAAPGEVPVQAEASLAAAGTAGGGVNAAATGAPAQPAPAQPAPAQPAPAQPAVGEPRIVRTGTVEIELRRGGFADALARLAALATGSGGFVAETRTSEAGRAPRGSVTIRIPASAFDGVVAEVRALGTVRSLTTQAVDVTGQFVDLEARIRTLDATRAQYLTLLTRARAIGDILAVQERLTDVQSQIEQLQGQRDALADRAALATLTVSVAEPGAGQPPERAGFAKAWDDAVDGFTGALAAILAASGTATVVLGVLALVAAAGRLLWLRLRRAAI